MPRSRPSDAPRAAASSSPVRRRSNTTRAPSSSTATITPIGPEAIVASTASVAPAAMAADSSASESPLEKVTSPTVEKAKSPKPGPSGYASLVNSSTAARSSADWSARTRSGSVGNQESMVDCGWVCT